MTSSSSDSPQRLLVVLGATGNQGGSIIRTYLSNPVLQSSWRIRGVTRNPSSPASRSLQANGIEMVAGSLDDPYSLTAAFESATAIFAVTDFWAPMKDPQVHARASALGADLAELAQQIEESWGSNIVLAASKATGLQRFIYSSLPPVRELTGGKLTHVRHFDGKANIVKMIETQYPDLWSKTSEIMIGHYNSNISPGSFFAPKYNASNRRFEIIGAYKPDDLIPYIDTPSSTGPFFWSLLQEKPGTRLIAFDEMKSRKETCEMLTRTTGKEFIFVQKTPDEIAKDAGMLGLEVAESGIWCGEYGFFGEKVKPWKETLKWPGNIENMVEVGTLQGWLGTQDWSPLLKQEESSRG